MMMRSPIPRTVALCGFAFCAAMLGLALTQADARDAFDAVIQAGEESPGAVERALDSAGEAIEKTLDTAEDAIKKTWESLEYRKENQPEADKEQSESADSPTEQQPGAESDDAEGDSDSIAETEGDQAEPAVVEYDIDRTPAIVYPDAKGQPVVVYAELHDMVAEKMRYTAHQAIEAAKAANAHMIVFEINTEGGRVDSAVHIRDDIMEAPMTTTAFVKRAISAGALITLSCDNIFMVRGSTIGAATPMMLTPGGATTGEEDIKEKMVSYLMKEFESTAKANNHRGDIARAFVDRRESIPGLVEAGKLLTLDDQEAVAEGLAIEGIGLPSEIYDTLNVINPQIINFSISTREQFALLISSAAYLCLGLGLMGLFFEIKTPGFGFPGIAGLFCIGLFFWANYVIMTAGWFDIILFIIGLVLIILEITVIPGFGIAGIGGIACIAVSIFLSMFEMPSGDIPLTWAMIEKPMTNLVLTLFISLILMILSLRVFHKTPFWKRIELGDTLAASEGFVSSDPREKHIGSIAESNSVLRPAGIVMIGGQRFDAMTQGDYIEKGQKVRVVGVDGAQLLVEQVKSKSDSSNRKAT